MPALRYLRARRKERFISVLAGSSFLSILLGVFTLITVMAVMNGFRKELFSKILDLNGHIIVHKIGGDDFDNYDEAARRLTTIPGVKQVLPLVEGQAMASMPHLAVAGLVRGMRENDLKSVRLVGGNIRFGSLDGFDRQDGVAIGTRLANALRVNAGDSITLITPRGPTTPFGTSPRVKPYKVAAIFEMGMSEYDRTMIFMPLAEAQRYFSKGNAVDVLELLVEDPEKVTEEVAILKQAGMPSLHFADCRYFNDTFFT